MISFRYLAILSILGGILLSGCAGLRLNLVNASVNKPSNVVVYFTVDTAEGEPVHGLQADQFKIYEDGHLISSYESKQTILNPEVSTVRYTLLLLDMSGSVVDSGQVPLIQEAVGAFLSNVGDQENVAIYAFDGREDIHPIAKFGSAAQKLSGRAEALSSWKTKDPSTNLNGAIIKSVEILQEARDSSDVPLRFGNIVVFTDGTDRAHRATSAQATKAVKNAKAGIYVIGLGGEVDQKEMMNLGRDGFVHVEQKDAVVQAFQKVAEKIKGLAARFYLLSYCSPSRAGRHELEVEAIRGELQGRLSYDFSADEFKPKCDPNTPPNFDVPGHHKAKKKRKKRKKKGGGSRKADSMSVSLGIEESPKKEEKQSSEEPPPPTGF